MVMQLFGSLAGAESLLLAFDDSNHGQNNTPSVVMAEAPHGTAPRLQGKNVANPLAMILAGAAVLSYVDERRAANASRAIYESSLETLHAGLATADLGGHATTTEYTDAVIEGVRRKLDVWSTL
jgi:isocitrate dehydrogenase (NAD+)